MSQSARSALCLLGLLAQHVVSVHLSTGSTLSSATPRQAVKHKGLCHDDRRTCQWYDDHPEGCGLRDTRRFSASETCCTCGGGDLKSGILSHHQAARELIAMEGQRVARILEEKGAKVLKPEEAANLGRLFNQTFSFTAQHTWIVFPEDDTTFCHTGDIGAMWLRDSSVANAVYLRLAGSTAWPVEARDSIRRVLQSVMKRQIRFMISDRYSSAFKLKTGESPFEGPSKGYCPRSDRCPLCSCTSCSPACGDWTYERKFELDSPLFVIRLHYGYWLATNSSAHLDSEFEEAVRNTLDLLRVEQNHNKDSKYSVWVHKSDMSRVKDGVGLVWSAFRPSDDDTRFGYNCPQNMLVVGVMRNLQAMPVRADIRRQARAIGDEVAAAIQEHCVKGGRYMFETDGVGNHEEWDDANSPNLLGIPDLGFEYDEAVYNKTRQAILSRENPNFFVGKRYRGLGSQHRTEGNGVMGGEYKVCSGQCIWHLGLITQGRTARSEAEKIDVLRTILNTHDGTFLLHEGFSAENPSDFNRKWFGWANSAFAEWLLESLDEDG